MPHPRLEQRRAGMPERMRLGSRRLLPIVLAVALPSAALAHPGSGIAVDRRGQVYFLDTGSGLWRIDTLGRLTRLSETRFHWMAIDEDDAFARTRLPAVSGGEIVRVGSSPTVLLSSDYPIAVGTDGNLYFQTRTGGLRLMKVTPSGVVSEVIAFPAAVTGEPLTYVGGITAGPGGTLYYTEDTAIRRVDASGLVSTHALITAPARPPSIPGTDQHPYLRGIAVDDRGATYVCDSGDARLLRVAADQTATTVLTTRSPWSPTAVAVHGRDIYVLEYLHTARDVRRDWLPRVRKIGGDGTTRIIATVDMMRGAR